MNDANIPMVCHVEEEILSDGSKVYDVVFGEERIYCLDEIRARTLVSEIYKLIGESM